MLVFHPFFCIILGTSTVTATNGKENLTQALTLTLNLNLNLNLSPNPDVNHVQATTCLSKNKAPSKASSSSRQERKEPSHGDSLSRQFQILMLSSPVLGEEPI